MDIRPGSTAPWAPHDAARVGGDHQAPAADRAPSPARPRVGLAGIADPALPARRGTDARAPAPHSLGAMADPRVRGAFPPRLGSYEQLVRFEGRFAPEVHHLLMASYLSQLPQAREALIFPVNGDAISRLNVESLRTTAQLPALQHTLNVEGYSEKEMLNWCADRVEFAADTRRRVADLCMQHRTSDERMHALDGLMDTLGHELKHNDEVLVRAGSGEHGVLVELRTVDATRLAMTIFNPGHGLDRFHAADPQRPDKYAQAFTTVFASGQQAQLLEDVAHHLLVQNELESIDTLYELAHEGNPDELYAVRYQQTQKGKDCQDEAINAYLKHRLGDLAYQAAKYTKLGTALERAAGGGPPAEGAQFPAVSVNGALALHGPSHAGQWTERVQSRLELRVFNTGQRLLAAIDRALEQGASAAPAPREAETVPQQAALVASQLRRLATQIAGPQ